jgi:hypothetical protein
MTALLERPAEVTASRRRASTITSTGFDYFNSSRVDEDISSCIRSFLLSRNVHYPPRTPFSSDEHLNFCSEDWNGVDAFDFGFAKSVAKSALHEVRRLSLSLPEEKMAFSQIIIPSMDGGATRKPTEAALRPSSPVETPFNDAEIPCYPPPTTKDPEEPKKFKFPRLALQD